MKVLWARILLRFFLAKIRAPARDEVAHWINWGRS
jgi:hypothetical protein